MKYRLKPESRPVNRKKELIICRPAFLSLRAKVKTMPNVVSHIKWPVGICSCVNILPSLLAKVSFVIKRVLLARVTINGTPNNALQIITRNKVGILRVNLVNVARARPLEIPSQNTKFHNIFLLNNILDIWLFCSSKVLLALSLLIATCFVKSCIIFFCYCTKLYNYIVPKVCRFSKQIIIIFGVIISLWVNTSHAATKAEILRLISDTEAEYHIPSGLLSAIAKIESNLEPYALNISGRSIRFQDKDAALQAIHQSLDQGITNIDIGIAQVNYKWHQHNFSRLEDMLLPKSNIRYAAKLLFKLKQQYGDWHTAIRYYHSANPYHYRKYSRKIVLCWLSSNKLTN